MATDLMCNKCNTDKDKESSFKFLDLVEDVG